MILAGDVGGTKTRLALFEGTSERLHCLSENIFKSRICASLTDAVEAFVGQFRSQIQAACFGVAGPVLRGRVETTNLPWVVDGAELGKRLGLAGAVLLINDLEANAHGLAALTPEQLFTLNPGAVGASGNAAIISAGTGLGEAGLFWDGERHRPFASEGGHSDFAPVDALQGELFAYLYERFGHVSWERVLSGPGLLNLYQFLRERSGSAEPVWLSERFAGADPSAVISQTALAGSCPVCVQALDLFVALYGAEAGNLALKLLATSGLYVGGGIAPRILPRLKDGPFMQAFVAKGRLRPLLEAIPVHIVLDDRAALLGAALCAQRSLSA